MSRFRLASAALAACLVAAGGIAVAQQPPPRGPVAPVVPRPIAPGEALMLDAGSSAVDSGVVVVQHYDGGQTFKFGEVDIEGRLKSPTLVYFLRRVRAEFAAGDLGHRSFLRELSQTRNGPSF
jgi:hypothetical protein